MSGLVIWGHARCRSRFGLYRAISQLLPAKIILIRANRCTTDWYRAKQGHKLDEFDDLPVECIEGDWGEIERILDITNGRIHIVADYQVSPVLRRVACEVSLRGGVAVIASESPWCRWVGLRRIAWYFYVRILLRWRVRKVIGRAKCFLNLSGSDSDTAQIIGWPPAKIVPWGYYPSPIVGSRCIRRNGSRTTYRLLVAGEMLWYRGHAIVIDAVRRLVDSGVPNKYKVLITGNGVLLGELKKRAEGLPVEFLGFVTIEKLISLYETCDIFLAPGLSEPWGMRVNDALNCGMPLIVSDGMGAKKLIEETGCGLTFCNGDSNDLAIKIESIAQKFDLYAEAAYAAGKRISPESKAHELVAMLGMMIT